MVSSSHLDVKVKLLFTINHHLEVRSKYIEYNIEINDEFQLNYRFKTTGVTLDPAFDI